MAEGRKFDADKLRYDLIPVEPMAQVARVYTIGAKKYNDRNWESGIKWGRIYAAIQRHLTAYWGGERDDQTDGQHHLASVVWGALALMEYERTHPELDDRKPEAGEQIKPIIMVPSVWAVPNETPLEHMQSHQRQFSYGARTECPTCHLWYNEEDGHVCISVASS